MQAGACVWQSAAPHLRRSPCYKLEWEAQRRHQLPQGHAGSITTAEGSAWRQKERVPYLSALSVMDFARQDV